MQKENKNNFAFIDCQNLNLAIRDCGWKIDWKRFRKYLLEKYYVQKAYLFLGFVPGQELLYTSLQEAGYIIIFKPTLPKPDGNIKGNCDAELVLQSMIDFFDYDQAVIVSGDGDFHCLVKYFITKNKLGKLIIPNQAKYSALLKRFPSEYLAFVSDLRFKLEYKKRTQ